MIETWRADIPFTLHEINLCAPRPSASPKFVVVELAPKAIRTGPTTLAPQLS